MHVICMQYPDFGFCRPMLRLFPVLNRKTEFHTDSRRQQDRPDEFVRLFISVDLSHPSVRVDFYSIYLQDSKELAFDSLLSLRDRFAIFVSCSRPEESTVSAETLNLLQINELLQFNISSSNLQSKRPLLGQMHIFRCSMVGSVYYVSLEGCILGVDAGREAHIFHDDILSHPDTSCNKDRLVIPTVD